METIRNAEILCVGTELLLGDIVNTNEAYIARCLSELGISLYRTAVVGDNAGRLAEDLGAALSRADLVILSGGLGPTYDDMTKETVAAYFGLPLVRDEESLEAIRAYFLARYGSLDRMTPNNDKQADVPAGARPIPNPNGTAPGILLEKNGKTVILLPGPPRELEPMMRDSVMPYLAERTGGVLLSRNIHIMGMGESAVEDALRDLMVNSTNPTLAPYALESEVRLRVTARAASAEAASSLCDEMVKKVRNSPVGAYVYGIDVGNVETLVVKELSALGLTVATAESCTAGMIASKLGDVPGASQVLLGGFITYRDEVKEALVGVRRETLDACTAVSESVAAEMAKGARQRLGADIGISATGYAGPGGGTAADPVGTVYIGISTKEGESVTRLTVSSLRSRNYVRTVAAKRALRLCLDAARTLGKR